MFCSRLKDFVLYLCSVLATMKCTCGPHPHIDLTAAYSNYHRSNGSNSSNSSGGGGGVSNNKDTNNSIRTCEKKIQAACISHGCFHITISLPNDNDNSNTDISKLPIDCLSKSTEEIEDDIESLFVPKFLQHVIQQQQSTAHIDCNSNNIRDDDICNGGLVEVSFPTSTILPTATHCNSDTTSATFRGRVAESGDGEEAKPEPKLSWEYRRCALGGDTSLQQKNTSTAQSNDACDNRNCNSDTEDEGERDTANNDEQCTLMPTWTEALHSVASTIIHLLDIPPQLVLQEGSCQCLSTNVNNDTKHTNKCQRCNIDLLRVFRYDAISSLVDFPLQNKNDYDGDNKLNKPQGMGSSPHSDWGTMTIVWQDDKGGLQTYCHACDVWSDVDASSSTKAEDTTTDKCGESIKKNNSSSRKCSLFVHIGDFLSLASIKGRDGSDYPMWPSPRHRVLCPTVRHENNKTVVDNKASAEDCRRSLVYFAYPPPDISLDTVQKVISPIISNSDSSIQSTKTIVKHEESSTNGFYNHYSLVHNQSKQSSSSAEGKDTSSIEERKEDSKELSAFQAYQTIKNLSFDKVIKDKWNQVQR